MGQADRLAQIDRDDGLVWLPALATAHSHAFQRAMRGRAQRPGPAGTDDFWSWRTEMYRIAASLTPESLRAASRLAFEELYRRGVRTVGEFHYVHHGPSGVPYEDRSLLSKAVIDAALQANLRIALLRVIYHRAGPGRAPEGAQLRFADPELDSALRDIEDLKRQYAGDSRVRIGVAPHSVRAVPPDWLAEIAAFARRNDMVVHMHVAEQPAEIAACLAETGKRPVELLADRGVLSNNFTAVHATHLELHEAALLGKAGAGVCLCPTTERDLGDGLPNVAALVEHGVPLSVGVDSHVVTAPIEDIRLIELGERLRTGKRVVVRAPLDETSSLSSWLWHVGSTSSARAVGFDDSGGQIAINYNHPDLAGIDDEYLLDGIVFGAQADVVMPALSR